MILEKDFEDFIKLLNLHQADYMVVGGYALAFHGKPRHTGDLDIWIAISEKNAEEARKNMQSIDIEEGFQVKYIGVHDFVKNKLASGRSQDIADVNEIKSL